jgi:hypothetical protein|tara:strand:+ start:4112 stop:4345 length:234 start_codon:yes stop_codon:yes gene_type:complete
MRQFRPSYEYKFKIVRILHETAKAILFLMKEHKVSIWVPKVWINRKGKTFFTVSDRKGSEIKLKMQAEVDALINNKV